MNMSNPGNWFKSLNSVLETGDALQCYECIAVGEASDDCKPEILMKDENAKTTCSINTMSEWHNKLAGHSSLSGIARVFRVDGNGQSSHSITPQTPMSCVKMVLRGSYIQNIHTHFWAGAQTLFEKIKKKIFF